MSLNFSVSARHSEVTGSRDLLQRAACLLQQRRRRLFVLKAKVTVQCAL